MRAAKTRFAAAGLLLVLAWRIVAAPPPDGDRCMLWKVSSATATVYLLGSLHVTTPEMYPLPQAVEDAFAGSDRLVVEVNMSKLDPQQLFALIGEKGVYKDGRALPDSIGGAAWTNLLDTCRRLGVPPGSLEKLKPWYAAMIVYMAQIEKLGYDPQLGMDLHFLELAAKRTMPVDELETADFQINLLANADAALQASALAMTLSDVKDMEEELAKLVAAWRRGDGEAIAGLFEKKDEETPEARAFMKKLIDDRNGPMAAKIERYLDGTGTVFAIAGCAHLVGTNGIVALLEGRQRPVQPCRGTAATGRD